MSKNDKVQEHVCEKTGKRFISTTDASGMHTLTVDAQNVHMTWCISPVCAGSSKLHARACSSAPRIRKGQLLHGLAMRTRDPNSVLSP